MSISPRYEELVAWQKAMELARETYVISQALPADERFGLTAQLRRAAVSVPSNIAEGQGRTSAGEFRIFLGNARGSLYEWQTQMKLAVLLGYVESERAETLLQLSSEVARLVNGLIGSLKK